MNMCERVIRNKVWQVIIQGALNIWEIEVRGDFGGECMGISEN